MKKISKKLQQILIWGFLLSITPLLAYAQSDEEASFDGETSLISLSEEMILFKEIRSVYSASKYEQKVTNAPSSVSIVTAKEIKKYGYRTLADILRSIRGIYVTYDRNYSYIGMRGFGRPGDYNTRVLLLVDGHRINDNIYEQAFIGTSFPVDVDLIDRVEIIRGPSSSIYGTNAFFGVINVITKRGRDLKGVEVSGKGGSFETQKYRLSYGNKFQNGLELFLSGSFYDSEGPRRLYFEEFDDPSTNNGIAEKGDDDQFYSLFSKLTFHDFTLQGAFVSREKGIPTAPWGTPFNDPRNRTIDERAYVDLLYEHVFSNQLGISSRLYYDRYDYDGYYPYDYADPGDPPDLVLNRDKSLGRWWGGELQVSKRLFEKHKFILGLEYKDNFRQDQFNYDADPFYQYLSDKRSTKNWAVYAQDEVQILENLIFNIGARHDHYQTFGGTTNPRAALIYNPFEKTTFKFLFGQAFRAPNFFELYYNDGDYSMKANPALDAEKILTYELVYEQYIGDNLRMAASGFYYKIKDLISQQTDPADDLLVFQNVDKMDAKGLELELEGKWPSGLEGRVSLALQDTQNMMTRKRLTNSPGALFKFNLIVPLIKEKLFAGTELRYTSKRKTVSGSDMESFVIGNLTLFSESLLKGVELSASVYNLFDKKYADPAFEEHEQDGIIQDGRTFLVGLSCRF